MWRKLLFINLLGFCLAAHLAASTVGYDLNPSTHEWIVGTSVFDGDRHGAFKNDLLTTLSDGSVWKIHPEDTEKYSQWHVDDLVHVNVRTDFYFFKREHKFELYNQTRRASVHAMLVEYPNQALVIMGSEVKVVSWSFVPVNVQDLNGHQTTTYVYREKKEKRLVLSDGSIWTLKEPKDFKHYKTGDKVLLGAHTEKDSKLSSFFISTGTEREGRWAWTTCIGSMGSL